MHQSITFDFYKKKLTKEFKLNNLSVYPLLCNEQNGEFNNVQCNSQNCFCVNQLIGNEIANTRTSIAEIEQTRRFLNCDLLLNNNGIFFYIFINNYLLVQS